jgi:hypothetical protein
VKPKYCLVLFLIALAALSLPSMVLAQTEPPSDPNAPWNPPPPSGSYAGYPNIAIVPGPGGGGGAILAYTADYQFNRQDTFSGSESFFVVLMTPFTNYAILWYEYYPPGSVPRGQWIIGPPPWWDCCYSGTVAFTAIPEPSEPLGQHAERFKIFDFASKKFYEAIARWTYGTVAPNTVTTSTSLGSLPNNPTSGQSITIYASVSPVPTGGTLTIQVSSPGGGWTPILSGSASSGSLSAPWSVPGGSGTYTFQAVYSGYLDSTANKQYQQSSSSPQTLTVQLISTSLTLSASPSSVAIDALTGSTGTITVTGTLSPVAVGAGVILTYSTPSGTNSKSVVVGPGGIFTDSLTPTTAGTYTISAQYMGDQSHQGSQSPPTSVVVTTSWTSVIAITGVVVLAVLVALILMLRRRSRQPLVQPSIQRPTSVPPPGSVFCGKCGTPNLSSNNFCHKCGTELTHEM